jgi:hypothetical protein
VFVRYFFHRDEQIARRTAFGAGIAFARHRELDAFVYAGRNIHLDGIFSEGTRPSPLQTLHGDLICLPRCRCRWGIGQQFDIMPKGVWVTRFTTPEPRQVPQVSTDLVRARHVPLQVLQTTCFLTLIFLLTPVAISSRVILTLMRRLVPRSPRDLPGRRHRVAAAEKFAKKYRR